MRSTIWLLKMAKWARNPPSPSRVKFVFGIIGVCLVLFGVEYFVGFPEWLIPDGAPKGRIKFP